MKKNEIYLALFLIAIVGLIAYSKGTLFTMVGDNPIQTCPVVGSDPELEVLEGGNDYLWYFTCPLEYDYCTLLMNGQTPTYGIFILGGHTACMARSDMATDGNTCEACPIHYCVNRPGIHTTYGLEYHKCQTTTTIGPTTTTTVGPTTTTIPWYDQTNIDSIPNWMSITVGVLLVALVALFYRKKHK